MKILFVITGLGLGGAERLVVDLADRYVLKGHEVIIAYFTGEARVLPRSSQVTLIKLPVTSLFTLVGAYAELVCLVRRSKPDVVHSHLFHANILARLARVLAPMRKLVSSAHNNKEVKSYRMVLYRLTNALADINTNVSQAAVNEYVERGGVRLGGMQAVYNGISLEKFNFSRASRDALRLEFNVPDGSTVLLSVGRLDRPKDYPNLLAAAACLVRRNVDFKWLVAGDGPLADELLVLLQSCNLEGYVSFLGARDDIPELMSASDVFVLSSAWEGFGLVVAEAMACERVVVATDCGGVREVVGQQGFIVPVGSPDKLSEAILAAINLPEDRRLELGLAARARIVDNFSIDAICDKWLSLYGNL